MEDPFISSLQHVSITRYKKIVEETRKDNKTNTDKKNKVAWPCTKNSLAQTDTKMQGQICISFRRGGFNKPTRRKVLTNDKRYDEISQTINGKTMKGGISDVRENLRHIHTQNSSQCHTKN